MRLPGWKAGKLLPPAGEDRVEAGRRRPTALLALLAAAPLAVPAVSAPAEPVSRRIVSLNPCVDAILYRIAAPGSIAAISNYSQDPAATSVPIDWARRYRAIYGTAEEVIALKPDLVITTRHMSLATRTALARARVRTMMVDVPASIAESEAQITDIAAAIGRVDAGARLNAQIDAALAVARPPKGQRPASALIYQEGGLVPGKATLADELLRRTGFTNASASYGLKSWDVLPLEPLVARPPRVVFTTVDPRPADGSFVAASRTMQSKALAMLGNRVVVANYPVSLLHCAGPTIIRASERLAAVRREIRQ